MKKKLLSVALAFALPVLVFALPPAERSIVKVRNSATSDGVLTFNFTPQGGINQVIRINIRRGWNALRVAREIANKLRTAIPRQYRATSRSHGHINCVDVEKDMMRYADFTLRHAGSTVDGLSIEIEDRD
jgi:hypothetical protein